MPGLSTELRPEPRSPYGSPHRRSGSPPRRSSSPPRRSSSPHRRSPAEEDGSSDGEWRPGAERGARRRQRNRDAARKSRLKTTERADLLHQELQRLEQNNAALQKEISDLQKDHDFYSSVLEKHAPHCHLRHRDTALTCSSPGPAPSPAPGPAPGPAPVHTPITSSSDLQTHSLDSDVSSDVSTSDLSLLSVPTPVPAPSPLGLHLSHQNVPSPVPTPVPAPSPLGLHLSHQNVLSPVPLQPQTSHTSSSSSFQLQTSTTVPVPPQMSHEVSNQGPQVPHQNVLAPGLAPVPDLFQTFLSPAPSSLHSLRDPLVRSPCPTASTLLPVHASQPYAPPPQPTAPPPQPSAPPPDDLLLVDALFSDSDTDVSLRQFLDDLDWFLNS